MLTQFGELGNYELLCFFGNQTMADVRSSFLQIRPQIFKNQRPFKFHYYDMADLQHPDRYWDEENKKRLRKCKHVLVNLEEYVRPLSQKEYEEQMINFVGHLIRLTKDDTFPIRIFTWTESAVETKNCHSPYLPWTNDHPCNDVLHKLFQQKVFPSRVKLLDNSPLTLPYFGKDAVAVLRPYLLAVIALRVFVITGEVSPQRPRCVSLECCFFVLSLLCVCVWFFSKSRHGDKRGKWGSRMASTATERSNRILSSSPMNIGGRLSSPCTDYRSHRTMFSIILIVLPSGLHNFSFELKAGERLSRIQPSSVHTKASL